jgi:beta-lactamase class A
VESYIGTRVREKKVLGVSVYFRDLNNGPTFGINEDEKFTPASLLKVPIMMAIFKKAEIDPFLLTSSFTYTGGGDDFTPSFPPSELLEASKSYTVEELIRRMIVYSDNRAKYLLLLNLEKPFLDEVYADLGISIPDVRTPESPISVKNYAAFWRILYNASYLERKYSEKALSMLSQTEFDGGIRLGVPSNITVAVKFGERGGPGDSVKQLHDCGIVYFPQRPYLLCAMTRGSDFNLLAETIADISRIVYTEIEAQATRAP